MVDPRGHAQGYPMKSLLPEQCRAARGMLDWTQEQLAASAGVSRSTVRDFEGCRRELQRATEALLIKAFEEAGVRLVFDPREPGVRLRANAIESHRRD
jgi:transcriptional regulator with XRE-family HTH domain